MKIKVTLTKSPIQKHNTKCYKHLA